MRISLRKKTGLALLIGVLMGGAAMATPSSSARPVDGFYSPAIKAILQDRITKIKETTDERERSILAGYLLDLLLAREGKFQLRFDSSMPTTQPEKSLIIDALLSVAAVAKDNKDIVFKAAEREAKNNGLTKDEENILLTHRRLCYAYYLAAIGRRSDAETELKKQKILAKIPANLEERFKKIKASFGKKANVSNARSTSRKGILDALETKKSVTPNLPPDVSLDLPSSHDGESSTPDAPTGNIPPPPPLDESIFAPPVGNGSQTRWSHRHPDPIAATQEAAGPERKKTGAEMAGSAQNQPVTSAAALAAAKKNLKQTKSPNSSIGIHLTQSAAPS